MDNYSTPGQPVDTNPSEGGDLPVAHQAGYSAESLLLNRLTTEVDGLKQALQTQAQQSSAEAHRLRTQLRWLTGMSVVAIVILSGALVGISLLFRQEQIALRENQQALVAQLEGLQSDQVSSEQLAQLETLLSSLNQTTGDLQDQAQDIIDQIPGASRDQLESLQNDLKDLQEDVQDQLSQEEGGVMDRVNGLFKRVQDFLGSGDNTEESPEESGT